MRKALLALLTLLFLTPTINHASERSKRLEKSVVYIESDGGAKCSGWVINSHFEKDKDLIASASHCDGKDITVDGQPARVKAKFQREDLLVLEVEDTGKPALKLALKNPEVEDEITSIGFGYAFEKPLVRHAEVSQVDIRVPDPSFDSEYIAIDAPFVPGQSGGPVFDKNDQVVMIVQFGTPSVGFGVGAEIIKKKLGKYFEK